MPFGFRPGFGGCGVTFTVSEIQSFQGLSPLVAKVAGTPLTQIEFQFQFPPIFLAVSIAL